MRVPFSPPDIGELEIAQVVDTLRSGWITTGPKTKELERQVARQCNTARAVCLNSATAALELTLRLLGIGPGDEVITSAYTYTASASVICHVGATPVLVDTAPGSYQMDDHRLEQAITPRTKAIIPVELGGVICDYRRLLEIVQSKRAMFAPANPLQQAIGRVALCSDAAHAFGATQGGRQCGEIADFTCFSFHAVKNFTTAEGGAVTWRELPGVDSQELYRRYQLLSLHGQSKDALAKTNLGAWEYDIEITGYKCNMTDIMAALGLAQMERYPGLLRRRRELIEGYNQALAGLPVETLCHYGPDFASSGHLCLVRLLGRGEEERNRLIRQMAEREIATNVHYKPLPMHTAYRRMGFAIQDYPNAYEMYKNEITLPLHTCLTNQQAQYVADAFRELVQAL